MKDASAVRGLTSDRSRGPGSASSEAAARRTSPLERDALHKSRSTGAQGIIEAFPLPGKPIPPTTPRTHGTRQAQESAAIRSQVSALSQDLFRVGILRPSAADRRGPKPGHRLAERQLRRRRQPLPARSIRSRPGTWRRSSRSRASALKPASSSGAFAERGRPARGRRHGMSVVLALRRDSRRSNATTGTQRVDVHAPNNGRPDEARQRLLARRQQHAAVDRFRSTGGQPLLDREPRTARSSRLRRERNHQPRRRRKMMPTGMNATYSLCRRPPATQDLIIIGARARVEGAGGSQCFAPARRRHTERRIRARASWCSTFRTVPRASELRPETRGARVAREKRSGVNVWGYTSLDVERGILCMPARRAEQRWRGRLGRTTTCLVLVVARRYEHRPLPLALPGSVHHRRSSRIPDAELGTAARRPRPPTAGP